MTDGMTHGLPHDPSRPPRLPYMPGVDGLRAIAVAAVVAYHLGASWLPGGFLGVDVFLVISGYLITSLLLAELRQAGRIDVVRFWLRRARRLLPALFLMLGVVLAVMVLAHPGEVAGLRGAVAASAAYVGNWYFAFADVPYFAQFGRPSVFQHLWSLAVEEQFYLVWPVVLAVGMMALGRRRLLVGVGVATAASALLAAALYRPDADPSRIYYGTDTRAVGLLAGVALAFVWPASRLAPVEARGARRVLDAVGAGALALLLGLMLVLGDLDAALYRGGFLAVGLVTAAVVAVAAHPSSRLGRALGASALVWIGLRSYAIYLWHWPVIMLTRPGDDVPFDGPGLVLLRLGLMVGAAALSYRFVEQPFRRHGIAGVREAVRGWSRRTRLPARVAVSSSAAAAVLGLCLAVALLPPSTPVIPGLAGAAAIEPGVVAPKRRAELAKAPGGPVLAVGDSVMLGAAPALRATVEGIVVDAHISRQFDEGAAAVAKGRRQTRPRTIVIHLGNNGYVPFDGLERLLSRLKRTPRVVLVTVRVPLKWEKSVNDALRSAAERHRNVELADWHAVSGGPGLLVDGVHCTTKGARLYARTIRAAVTRPG
jgi:peptidoglycan/LPS O-acetylase OafA/YrhL